MKTLTYEYEKMVRAGQLLNKIVIQGIEQARCIAEIGDILDSGKIGEIIIKENDGNGMEHKEIQSD